MHIKDRYRKEHYNELQLRKDVTLHGVILFISFILFYQNEARNKCICFICKKVQILQTKYSHSNCDKSFSLIIFHTLSLTFFES